MPTQNQIRKQITDKIVAALKENLLPWRKPWRVITSPNTGRPSNVLSQHIYTGINPLLLELTNMRFGFQSKWWGTFRQWQNLDCTVCKRPDNVQRGEWGTNIVFYRPVEKKTRDPETGETKDEQFFVMRTFTVFNAEQVEGEAAQQYHVPEEPETEDTVLPNFEPADELISATNATIRHQGNQAFYKRPVPFGDFPEHTDGDYIVIPPKQRFDTTGCYYETILHELAHWSETRLNWDHKEHGYAMGELVAEIASSFLSAELGVPQGEEMENHVAYLQSWLAEMQNDPSFIFRASTQATKVSDFLLAFTKQPVSVEV